MGELCVCDFENAFNWFHIFHAMTTRWYTMTSEMSNAKLFNDVETVSKRCLTMSKHSDDENDDFSLFDKFNSLSYVESDDSKCFSRQLRYLFAVEIASLRRI